MSTTTAAIPHVPRPVASFRARHPWRLLSLVLLCPTVLWSAPKEPQQKSCELPLVTAMQKGDLAKVRSLIHSGVDLNARDCYGAKALNEAIALRLPDEIVEKLVKAGARPNALGVGDDSPLSTASWYCRRQIVQFLLVHGADVNAVDTQGYSALIQASQNCSDGSVTALLLRSGANVNAKVKDGDTALIVAAGYGNEHTVHVLVAAGADLEAKDRNGKTALAIARDRDVGRKESHDRIYQFLLEASKAGKPEQRAGGEGPAVEPGLEEKHAAEEAKAKELFVQGPVLVLPVSQNFWYTFDWDAVLKLDEGLTLYGGDVKVADQWGMLEASEGVVLVREHDKILRVQVPAPSDSAKVPLIGNGWTLNLKSGWKIVPGNRARDITVRQRGSE